METKTVVLDVDGMTCGGCVGAVNGALERVEGVRSVEVSLEDKSATLTVVSTLDAARLAAAVPDQFPATVRS